MRRSLIAAAFVFVVVFVIFSTVPPISQDPAYHNFADKRSLFGIPNFLDVASNAPFLIGGFHGVYTLMWRAHPHPTGPTCPISWSGFFLSGSCVSVGSAYYHLGPTTATLFWDRLPMTVSFMSIVSVLISERISHKSGDRWLLPLIGVGVSSVLWWAYTEWTTGLDGDLRLYVLVQAAPVLMTPFVLAFYQSQFTHSLYLLGCVGFYTLAKIMEHFDHEIFRLTFGLVSGHTLKHIAASLGIFCLSTMLSKRRLLIARD
jgi:hypothetical protein